MVILENIVNEMYFLENINTDIDKGNWQNINIKSSTGKIALKIHIIQCFCHNKNLNWFAYLSLMSICPGTVSNWIFHGIAMVNDYWTEVSARDTISSKKRVCVLILPLRAFNWKNYSCKQFFQSQRLSALRLRKNECMW